MTDKLKKVKDQPWATNKALIDLLEEFDTRLSLLEDKPIPVSAGLVEDFHNTIEKTYKAKEKHEKKEKENKVSA